MYLLSLGSQIYVYVLGIEGESPDVIHDGLSELAGQEMFGESVWVKIATQLCFRKYAEEVNV